MVWLHGFLRMRVLETLSIEISGAGRAEFIKNPGRNRKAGSRLAVEGSYQGGGEQSELEIADKNRYLNSAFWKG